MGNSELETAHFLPSLPCILRHVCPNIYSKYNPLFFFLVRIFLCFVLNMSNITVYISMDYISVILQLKKKKEEKKIICAIISRV